MKIKSVFVIISWWSNCLALKCLNQLLLTTNDRTIYIVQNGKSKENRERFSGLLDSRVQELPYPENAPGEHYMVLEYLIKNQLQQEKGVWFLDHDAFITDNNTQFFEHSDNSFTNSQKCLFTPSQQTLTNPAFWISPARLPDNCPSLAPEPARTSKLTQRPDLYTHQKQLESPTHDTLVVAYDYLKKREMATSFPLEFFPEHHHIGGLHVLNWPVDTIISRMQSDCYFKDFLHITVKKLISFYQSCTPQWLAIEESSLLNRLSALNGLF